MVHEEAVSFIKDSINTGDPQMWAELGCGTGTFTKALITQLPIGSTVIAVDKVYQDLKVPHVNFVKADFENDALNFTGLSGILMANSFHYIEDKVGLIKRLETSFAESPRLIIIEYDTDKPNVWLPFPIPFDSLVDLFKMLGYRNTTRLNERRSTYGNMMYCALIEK